MSSIWQQWRERNLWQKKTKLQLNGEEVLSASWDVPQQPEDIVEFRVIWCSPIGFKRGYLYLTQTWGTNSWRLCHQIYFHKLQEPQENVQSDSKVLIFDKIWYCDSPIRWYFIHLYSQYSTLDGLAETSWSCLTEVQSFSLLKHSNLQLIWITSKIICVY